MVMVLARILARMLSGIHLSAVGLLVSRADNVILVCIFFPLKKTKQSSKNIYSLLSGAFRVPHVFFAYMMHFANQGPLLEASCFIFSLFFEVCDKGLLGCGPQTVELPTH